jgi:methylase of polypeptide subunit release factors
MDTFYTSSALADILISHINNQKINTVADFCVGGGELLRSAQMKWKDVKIFGTDISKEAISNLNERHPDWNVEYCDFLDEESKSCCKLLRDRTFDLILLNPPFTCKGSKIHKVEFEGLSYHVSTAMLFLLKSISYINAEGIIIAILPVSAAYSQKDHEIWNVLEAKYNLTIIEERDKQYFKACYPPNIIIASLNDFSIHKKTQSQNKIDSIIKIKEITRGQLSMNEIIEDTNSTKLLIHSTNLRNNKIVNVKYKVNNNYPLISGPGVVIHRVGNPKPSKVCAIKKTEKYILSDCLIFIKTETYTDSKELKEYILSNWTLFERLYKGTGAKYITLKRLKAFFEL